MAYEGNRYAGLNSRREDKASWLEPALTAAGAVVGSIVPGVGTAAGAAAGRALGSAGHSMANGGGAESLVMPGMQAFQTFRPSVPQTGISPQGGGTQPTLPTPDPSVPDFGGMDNRSILQMFMQNPSMFRRGYANGGLVTGPAMDLVASQWAEMDPVQRAMLQAQQAAGPAPTAPTPTPLQQAQHPTLEALSGLLPQIMAAMPRPANPRNTKAIGAWLPAAGLALSAPAAIAQSRRASANAPIEERNKLAQSDYEARRKAYEDRKTKIGDTLVGNATKPFAPQEAKEEGPMVDIPGVGRVPATSGIGGDRLRKMRPDLFPASAAATARSEQEQSLSADAETAAEEIASFGAEPKVQTSNRYPGYAAEVTALVNKKLREKGSPYTLQQLQTMWREKQNWLTTNNAQRFTLMRQAAVTVRKHIEQMKDFYKTYGNIARPSGFNTIGKSQFDLALEGLLGSDARAAAEAIALNQDFVASESALVMSAGFAPHKEVVDRMAKRLQVATKGRSAGLATIKTLESLVGARIQTALDSTPFAGGKRNPYLIDVSPIEGWNEAGGDEDQPKKKSGWMPDNPVEVGGN